MDDSVWYASYGSNMWWERFRCYLEGGTPPGATHSQRGARDPSPPSDSREVLLPYRMYFAGRASSWGGGGVSFLDHERLGDDDPDRAWGRAWRITREQFDDVVAQENRLEHGELIVDLDGLEAGDARDVTAGWYGRLVLVDRHQGAPVVTFTSPQPLNRDALNAPSAAYLRTIAQGLATRGDMPDEAIGEYLAAAPGAAGAWSVASVMALLG
jgi:hypothetical protein